MNTRQEMRRFCACLSQQDELYSLWAKRQGLSPNTAMVLYALDQGAATQGQIAREWMIPKQTVHTVVNDLERQGYLCREGVQGQKEKQLAFTELGRQFATDKLADVYQLEERAVQAMGAERFSAMVEANQAFTAAFAQEVLRGT